MSSSLFKGQVVLDCWFIEQQTEEDFGFVSHCLRSDHLPALAEVTTEKCTIVGTK